VKRIRITGALINAAAILAGGGIGLLFKGKISEKISENITRAIGLCVCIIGISGALKGDIMLLVASLALGTVVGELINIDGGLNKLGLWLQKKLTRKDEKSTFAEGFVAATLLFCVGAMAIVGSIESGIRNDQSVIITKSILDAVTSIALASTFGFGVLFSAGAILIYQGSIEIFAGFMQNVLTDDLVTQISSVGGLLILGIGLNMVLNAKIRVANMLPGLLFAAGYYYLFII
jgi:uncharacterized membrane protein YqgA involved in biofilm formation